MMAGEFGSEGAAIVAPVVRRVSGMSRQVGFKRLVLAARVLSDTLER